MKDHYRDVANHNVEAQGLIDDDLSVKDTLIYNNMGTSSTTDDIIIMVLIDFVTDETFDIDSALFAHNLVA